MVNNTHTLTASQDFKLKKTSGTASSTKPHSLQLDLKSSSTGTRKKKFYDSKQINSFPEEWKQLHSAVFI